MRPQNPLNKALFPKHVFSLDVLEKQDSTYVAIAECGASYIP